VGELDGGLQAVRLEGQVGLQAVGPGDVLLFPGALADESGQRLDGELGGAFARVVTSHPVAEGVEVGLGVDEVVVLVQLAAAAHVGLAERLEHGSFPGKCAAQRIRALARTVKPAADLRCLLTRRSRRKTERSRRKTWAFFFSVLCVLPVRSPRPPR